MSIEFSPRNPVRSPSWRWDRARNVLEDGVPFSRRRDDKHVRRAIEFRRRLEEATVPSQIAALELYDEGLFWAHQIFHQTDEYYEALKHELEARILAQDTTENTARRCCATLETVLAYETVFFNVSERIENRGYILHRVLGPQIHDNLRPSDWPLLWKVFGYFGGPVVLDMMIDQQVDPQRPNSPSELSKFVQDLAAKAITRKAAVAAHTMGINDFNSPEIIEQFTKLLAVEKAAGAGGGGPATSLGDNVEACLKAVRWLAGPRLPSAPGVEPTLLQQYDTKRFELHGNEAMQLQAGNKPVLTLGEEDWSYPEPKATLPDLTDEELTDGANEQGS
jgi:hypothetical protein